MSATYNARARLTACAFTLTFGGVGTAQASENGTVAYPTGIYSQNAAIVPAQGATSIFTYTNVLDADTLVGKDGQSVAPNFHATVIGQAIRVVHTWDVNVKGLHFTTAVAPVFAASSVQVSGRRFSRTDMRQIFLTPLAMTAALGRLHLLLSEDVFIPVGKQRVGDPSSVALGNYSLNTMAAATWFPNPRWDFSVWTTYGRTTTNTTTNYKSGDYLDVDYGVLFTPMRNDQRLSLGIGGYYLQQLTDDQRNGIVVPGGSRMEQIDVGPMVRWRFSRKLAAVIKWQHPALTRNSAEGERFWLQIAVHLPKWP